MKGKRKKKEGGGVAAGALNGPSWAQSPVA